jgi:hypothetical protein
MTCDLGNRGVGGRRGALGLGLALALALALAVAGCEGRTLAFVTPGLTGDTPAAVPLGKAGCVPNCRRKGCGDDGCGGHCGTCPKGRICLADRCVRNTAGELCRLVDGRWTGTMHTYPVHYLDGRIYRRGKACHATLRVSYRLPRAGPAWVVQELVVTFTGTNVRLRGVRISSASGNSNYNLDRFTGSLNRKLNVLTGTNRDVRGSASRFTLRKK